MRAILPTPSSVNHMPASGPLTMVAPDVSANDDGTPKYVKVLVIGLKRPILLLLGMTNHRLPSGPPAMSLGCEPGVNPNSASWFPSVMRPIRVPVNSVNHTLLKPPTVIPKGVLDAVGMMKSVSVPVGVMRSMLFLP